MRKFLYIILYVGIVFTMKAQSNCKVKLLAISDNYVGECKKGLAHGYGVASGTDQYKGKFKKGWPEGKGNYTWNNGNSYVGEWQTGKQDGEGELTIKRTGRPDSILTGFWKDGEYIGKYLNPYELGFVRNINRKRILRRSEKPNQVYFYFKQNGLDKQVSNFVAVSSNGGNYFEQKTYKGYSDLRFPAELRLTFVATDSNGNNPTNCEFNIEIFEEGTWEITLNL